MSMLKKEDVDPPLLLQIKHIFSYNPNFNPFLMVWLLRQLKQITRTANLFSLPQFGHLEHLSGQGSISSSPGAGPLSSLRKQKLRCSSINDVNEGLYLPTNKFVISTAL